MCPISSNLMSNQDANDYCKICNAFYSGLKNREKKEEVILFDRNKERSYLIR